MYEERWCVTEPWIQLEKKWIPVHESGYWTWQCPDCGYEEPILESVQSAILETAGVVPQPPQQQE